VDYGRSLTRVGDGPPTTTTEAVDMRSFERDSMDVALQGDGLDVRVEDAGGMSVGMFRLPAGTDLRPALNGLEGNLCQCPHWGYMLKGTLRMHTANGVQEYVAGQAFYWAPGHAPEAVDDVEYVDFSPAAELHAVLDHVKQQSAA
jgi:hypothetical protein